MKLRVPRPFSEAGQTDIAKRASAKSAQTETKGNKAMFERRSHQGCERSTNEDVKFASETSIHPRQTKTVGVEDTVK